MVCFNSNKVVLSVFAMYLLVACDFNKKEIDKEAIVKAYIDGLNTSNYDQVVGLFLDSVRFNEMDYRRTFSKQGYRDLFQWDSVFRPKYAILEIKGKDNELHLKVSKKCDRILFLQNKPFVTHEVMKIEEGKIQSIDVVEYLDFNDDLWVRNREQLVNWVSEHHPELDGFIYDQTKVGAQNFTKAMELYGNRNNVAAEQENSSK